MADYSAFQKVTPTAATEADPAYAGFRRVSDGPSTLESFGRGTLEGATFGFESTLGLANRAAQERSRATNPWIHFAGEMLGGIAPMAAASVLPGGQAVAVGRLGRMGYRASQLARGALLPGEIGSLGQAAAQGAKLGAVYGGLSGAGHTETAPTDSLLSALGQRAVGAGKGAAVGAAFGIPLGAGLYGGSQLIGAAVNRAMPNLSQVLEAASTPELQGIRDVVRNAGYDKYTMADFAALRDRLRDPSQAHRYQGLNLIEALETKPLQAAPVTGELRAPPVMSPNLNAYAKNMANTAGTGRHEAAEAFAIRQDEMASRILGDVDRLFGAAPASRADDLATITGTIDRVTGAGNAAAVEAKRLANQAAFNQRYDRLREAPLVLNQGLGDILHIPEMQKAIAYAANNDMINAPAGTSWGRNWVSWARANAQGVDDPVPAAGITLSPANILDIHHILAVNARPPMGQVTQESMMAGNLKQRFADWVAERLKKFPKLNREYAMFKRALEAEDMGASLPLVTGGRNHAAMDFIAAVNQDEARAAAAIAKALPASQASQAAFRAGTSTTVPRVQALRTAMAQSDAMVEVQEAFRRAWGESIKDQFARTTDPAQVSTLVRQMLSPAGRERIQTVLGGGPEPQAGTRVRDFLQQLTVLDARNHGLAMGLRSGGSDSAAIQFLAQAARDGNVAAVDAFRAGWGDRIRQEISAATTPAQVTAAIRQLLTLEGKNRILRVLGPAAGREFIESLYSKAKQAYLGQRIYGGSDTAFKQADQQRLGYLGQAVTALAPWSFQPAQILPALRGMAQSAYAQRRADQGNRLLSRQGPAEVEAILDTILARNQLRASGQPRLAASLVGPAASVLPVYQQPQRRP